jgi:excisionase family DNA binding protein
MEKQLLTLQEMAALLGVSAQTFRKDVKGRGIPHLIVGKRARFDPVRVQAYLVAKAETPSNVVRLKIDKPQRRTKAAGSRFAEKVNASL